MTREVDLVIRGARVVSPDQIIEASVAIAGEHIVAVGHDDTMPPARAEMRADGLHLLPGAIDSHVHFRDPGYPQKEDFASGTASGVLRMVANDGGWTPVHVTVNRVELEDDVYAGLATLRQPTAEELTSEQKG